MKSNGRKIFFRVDGGGRIGRGHISRCESLATEFYELGLEPVFVVRKRPSTAHFSFKFPVVWLPQTADVSSDVVSLWRTGTERNELESLAELLEPSSIVVIDHYGLGVEFQRGIKQLGHSTILFQDDPDEFDADVLINYNIHAQGLYSNLKPKTKYLIGTKYAPLAREYALQHQLRIPSSVNRIGIYVGGVPNDHLGNLASALAQTELFSSARITWVLSSEAQRNFLSEMHLKAAIDLVLSLPHMSQLYTNVDLFIGACGVSFLERACMGLWQVNVVAADNQKQIAAFISAQKMAPVAGPLTSSAPLADNLATALSMDRASRDEMIRRAFAAVDGEGAKRLAEECLAAFSLN